MARNPRNVKPAAVADQTPAPAATIPNDPGANMDRIMQLLGFAATKREFTKDDPMIAQVAEAAGKGLPIEEVEALLSGLDLANATVAQLRVALACGSRLLDFLAVARESKAGNEDITSSATAWALKMGKVAVDHRNWTDEQVMAHSDAQPSTKSPGERAESRIKRALTLLEEAGDLLALTEADGAKWSAILAKIEGFEPAAAA